MKRVSIIIPVYNVEKYLIECLESVVNQTYYNLQIIIVDDGSTDNSGKICDDYAKKDCRINVIHQNNLGAANAKNTGLNNVNGEYIAFLDSDDYVSLNWIETMVNAIEKYAVDFVECGFDMVYVNGIQEGKTFEDAEKLTTEKYLEQYNYNWESAVFWNKLFKIQIVKDIRFRKERRCIDDEFFTYKVISNGNEMVRLGDVMYHYRQRKTSAVNNLEHSLQITDDTLDVLIERYDWLTARFPKLKKVYLKSDINKLLFYPEQMLFNDTLVKKHKRISRYYFKRCIQNMPEMIVLMYACRLLLLKKSCFNKNNLNTENKKNVDYYFE